MQYRENEGIALQYGLNPDAGAIAERLNSLSKLSQKRLKIC
jgi:hypothetical protein